MGAETRRRPVILSLPQYVQGVPGRSEIWTGALLGVGRRKESTLVEDTPGHHGFRRGLAQLEAV